MKLTEKYIHKVFNFMKNNNILLICSNGGRIDFKYKSIVDNYDTYKILIILSCVPPIKYELFSSNDLEDLCNQIKNSKYYLMEI